MSLISTGKTMGDHALSAVMDQDCRVWRIVEGETVCRELMPGEINPLIAEARRWEASQEIVGDPESVIRARGPALIQNVYIDPVVVPNCYEGLVTGIDGIIRSDDLIAIPPSAFWMGMFSLFGDPAAKTRTEVGAASIISNVSQATLISGWTNPDISDEKPTTPLPETESESVIIIEDPMIDSRVVVLGSFGKRANAMRAVRKWRDIGVSIVSTGMGATKRFRVVTAPIAGKNYESELRRIRSIGVLGAWAMRLCGRGKEQSGDCIVLQTSGAE